MTTDSHPRSESVLGKPLLQLMVGIICMVMIANLQYGWTLFVGPIIDRFHWGRATIQLAFTIFVVFETWLVPAQGYMVDKFGPRWMIVGGGILCGLIGSAAIIAAFAWPMA